MNETYEALVAHRAKLTRCQILINKVLGQVITIRTFAAVAGATDSPLLRTDMISDIHQLADDAEQALAVEEYRLPKKRKKVNPLALDIHCDVPLDAV